MTSRASGSGDPREVAPFELDLLYNDIDKLYHGYARGCGLSDCAYWMMYDLELAGGAMPLALLTSKWAYSKQTINSALKTLGARDLVELSFAEGSRKSKQVALTERGREFSRERIVPAIEAEKRAFSALSATERSELVRMVRHYARALEEEMSGLGSPFVPDDPGDPDAAAPATGSQDPA